MSTGNNSATDAVTTPESPTTAAPTTTSQEPTTAAPTTQAPDPTTTTAAPEPTTTPPTTQNPNTDSSTRDRTTTTQPTTTREPATSQPTTLVETTVVTNPTDSGQTSTFVITRTTTPTTQSSGSGTTTAASSPSTTISSGSSGGLSTGGKIAVAVVVPIAAVALIVVAGLFFWRKRRARKDAKEARKQEIDDYGYNPNNDPTIPPLPAAGAYEMKDENTSGYRGWGSTTLSGSVGNKASTTISGGGVTGATYSDMASPAYANASDTRSGEPLMSDGTVSPEGEILGAMGPSANQTRGGDVHRGPSNASSHYSVAQSDDSGGIGRAYGGPNAYYEQYSQANPYADNPYSVAPGAHPGPNPGAVEMAGQPVIRDNPHRRNTRIENPSPYAQQPGISQNF